jgi:hypothetical protein
MKRKLRLLSAAILVGLAPVVHAQAAGEVDTQVSSLSTAGANAGQTRVATRIASSFDSLAGSHDNSLALVWGLRTGTPVTLAAPSDSTGGGTGATGGGTTTGTGGTGDTSGSGGTATGGTGTTITPPTGKMGWGEVFISLALAKAELANMGIADPTPGQLQAALTGGDITAADGTTTTVKGILEMRADGMGWGRIAQAEGMKLGPVVSSIKSARVQVASLPTGSPPSKTASTLSGKSLTTAAGTTTAPAKGHRGIVTASGAPSSLGGARGHKGIVSAAGPGAVAGGNHASRGITTASGLAAGSASQGIVTAEGGTGGGAMPHGHAFGRGVVTGAGGSAGVVAVNAAGGHGAGVVTASGGAMASGGITSAQGGGNGELHGRGHKGGG